MIIEGVERKVYNLFRGRKFKIKKMGRVRKLGGT